MAGRRGWRGRGGGGDGGSGGGVEGGRGGGGGEGGGGGGGGGGQAMGALLAVKTSLVGRLGSPPALVSNKLRDPANSPQGRTEKNLQPAIAAPGTHKNSGPAYGWEPLPGTTDVVTAARVVSRRVARHRLSP